MAGPGCGPSHRGCVCVVVVAGVDLRIAPLNHGRQDFSSVLAFMSCTDHHSAIALAGVFDRRGQNENDVIRLDTPALRRMPTSTGNLSVRSN